MKNLDEGQYHCENWVAKIPAEQIWDLYDILRKVRRLAMIKRMNFFDLKKEYKIYQRDLSTGNTVQDETNARNNMQPRQNGHETL